MMRVPELGARSAAASITCSSTNTRTPTAAGVDRRLLKPDGHGSPSSAMTPRLIYGFRAATVRNILDFPAQ